MVAGGVFPLPHCDTAIRLMYPAHNQTWYRYGSRIPMFEHAFQGMWQEDTNVEERLNSLLFLCGSHRP